MSLTMTVLGYIFLGIYLIALAYITIFCLLQFHLLFLYNKQKKKQASPTKDLSAFPQVTIQLPIFNEMYVVERLIDNIVKMEYPKEKLEIQILDDSTDETLEISRKKVEEYQQKGFDIQLLHLSLIHI